METTERRNNFLGGFVVFLVAGVLLGPWRLQQADNGGLIMTGLMLTISATFLILAAQKRRVLLMMDKDGIAVRNKHISYGNLEFAYFKFIIGRGTSVSIVFVEKDGREHSIYLPYLGYSKEMLGRIVYTKLKLAKENRIQNNPHQLLDR